MLWPWHYREYNFNIRLLQIDTDAPYAQGTQIQMRAICPAHVMLSDWLIPARRTCWTAQIMKLPFISFSQPRITSSLSVTNVPSLPSFYSFCRYRGQIILRILKLMYPECTVSILSHFNPIISFNFLYFRSPLILSRQLLSFSWCPFFPSEALRTFYHPLHACYMLCWSPLAIFGQEHKGCIVRCCSLVLSISVPSVLRVAPCCRRHSEYDQSQLMQMCNCSYCLYGLYWSVVISSYLRTQHTPLNLNLSFFVTSCTNIKLSAFSDTVCTCSLVQTFRNNVHIYKFEGIFLCNKTNYMH
jgi:hypothetical protein